jgi:5,6-dimethylbenzimidazole synthase
MQPWDFILIDDLSLRQAVKQMVTRETDRAAANYVGEQARLYRSLKLDGILDSPLNLCVTCDRSRGGPHVPGRNTILALTCSAFAWLSRICGWQRVWKVLWR